MNGGIKSSQYDYVKKTTTTNNSVEESLSNFGSYCAAEPNNVWAILQLLKIIKQNINS